MEQVKYAILENLAAIFGPWAKEPCDFYVKDWAGEPFIGGGSACIPTPDSMHAFHALSQPHQSVHFAGAETVSKNYGTICGAIESGQRAAIEVLEELKPQCLSSHDLVLIRKSAKLPGSLSLVSIHPSEPVLYSNVFRWTMVLPLAGIAAGLIAIRFRDKYCQLFIPKF